ncbi:Heavy metal transport/detoxification superfamily protein [Abeliophyllum distichum]|uniref:Heavy metal transport/detoxification superfamily protein n=1 Tax=Abeliophyllum distichum TaxID=126358 RepID=A0ABD1VSB1_9LAMI
MQQFHYVTPVVCLNPNVTRRSIFKISMMEISVPNLDCEGCASKLRKALFELKGVKEVDIDMEIQKVTVRGYGLEEKKVFKAVKSAGKTAEPWPYDPYPGYSYFHSFYQYYDTSFFQTPDDVASLFSDDNPHACTTM